MIDFDALANATVTEIFGQDAIYTPNLRPPQMIVGVFDKAYLPVLPLGDVENEIGMPAHITERRPILGVQLSQFLFPPEPGDMLTVAGIVYVVREIQEDGQGWAKLMLHVAS